MVRDTTPQLFVNYSLHYLFAKIKKVMVRETTLPTLDFFFSLLLIG